MQDLPSSLPQWESLGRVSRGRTTYSPRLPNPIRAGQVLPPSASFACGRQCWMRALLQGPIKRLEGTTRAQGRSAFVLVRGNRSIRGRLEDYGDVSDFHRRRKYHG